MCEYISQMDTFLFLFLSFGISDCGGDGQVLGEVLVSEAGRALAVMVRMPVTVMVENVVS